MGKPPACDRGLSVHLRPQHSCRGVLSLDDEQRGDVERECRPRHNQDECHFDSCRDVTETNGTTQPPRRKKNPRKSGCVAQIR
jgi:hypothetical protein